MVSVCITHYNRPHLLQQALQSIADQDYDNIEVVLVDDGSTTAEALSYLTALQSSFDAQGWSIVRTSNRYEERAGRRSIKTNIYSLGILVQLGILPPSTRVESTLYFWITTTSLFRIKFLHT